MADETQQPAQPGMKILAQYIRDMSFENILSQKGASGEVAPDVQIQVNIDAKKRTVENQFEIVIKLKVNSVNKGTTENLFLLEIEYAGCS